jgi:hypothetical protein
MSMNPINNLSSSYLQSVLASALQGTGLTNNATGNGLNGIKTSSLSLQPDHSQLSPFAQLMNTLQQLQQADPAKYQYVTQQTAANLQSAAQTAQQAGDTGAANQLNQLAADFANASKSGQLPNVQDLAQAIGGHHHHHHQAQQTSADTSGDSGANEYGTATQNESLNPMSIILNTVSGAGA